MINVLKQISAFIQTDGWPSSILYFIIIIIYVESAVQGRERGRTLYQSEDPNSTQPAHGKKEKGK